MLILQGVYFKVGRDWIIDGHILQDGRKVVYKYVDNAFCHPNPHIATATANWYQIFELSLIPTRLSSRIARNIPEASTTDLLELYCGNGNHSMVLSPYFRKVSRLVLTLTDISIRSLELKFVMYFARPPEKTWK
jgi:tRNA (uracil-5-)-methyltransferase